MLILFCLVVDKKKLYIYTVLVTILQLLKFRDMVDIKLCASLNYATIYKMFASRPFQALKNNPSVGQHIFFHFFYIFNIFIPSSVGKKTKRD